MKILSWNVCGIGSPWSIRRIQQLLREYCPHVIFFIEAKLDENKMEKIHRKFGYFNGIDVPADGTRGGLSLGWQSGVEVDL